MCTADFFFFYSLEKVDKYDKFFYVDNLATATSCSRNK